MGKRAMLLRIVVFAVTICALPISYAQPRERETTTLRHQYPRITAQYEILQDEGCIRAVTYQVWLQNEIKASVTAEICAGKKESKEAILGQLKEQVGWSSPYLSIRESCAGSNFMCEAGRALILANGKTVKRLGTFTDFIYLQDQTLIVGALETSSYPFIGNAGHQHVSYISTVESDQLVYSKELTWLLNHSQYSSASNLVERCVRRKMLDCKSWDVNSALLFMAELATISDRSIPLKKTLTAAESILSPLQNREFLQVVHKVQKPNP